MAGDWIKFELATLDKPEVCQIADFADIDLDAVVGKLLRVWSWFDQQTSDGNAPSVSKKLLDRLVGVSGFCDYMKLVDWMQECDGVISLPHFERHNGKTAKNRLLTAKRVANYKSGNAKGNAPIVTSPLANALPKEDVDVEKKELLKALVQKRESQFEIFYAAYPNKQKKADALKAWTKHNADCSLTETIMASLALHKAGQSWAESNGKFIPHPSSWLNAQRWNDEVIPHDASTPNRATGRLSAVDQVKQAIAEREARTSREAATSTDRQALAENDGNVRPPLDGEFRHVG